MIGRMRLLGFRTIGSACRALWAALRAPRERLTLGQLRSDLSHEAAAKLARLSGLSREWSAGRFHPDDPNNAAAILRDLDGICLRHARLAAASFRTFGGPVRLLSALTLLRSRLAPLRRDGSLTPAAAAEFAGALRALQADFRACVELLSGRHTARLDALLNEAVTEIRKEVVRGNPGNVSVALALPPDAPVTWLPRRDADTWSDILRNLVRNAVQATEERPDRTPNAAVTVRCLPLPNGPGTAVEIIDDGRGMSPDEIATMWTTGRSSHGPQHGQGLTEGKRDFVTGRADLEIRSAPGVGTCVRIVLPHHEIAIRPPHLWAMPPLTAPLLAILASAALASGVLFPPPIVSVEVKDAHVVCALGAQGELLWQRDMHENVQPNYLGTGFTDHHMPTEIYRHLVFDGRWPWDKGVILATQPTQGPARLWRLDARGGTRWVRTLGWTPPRNSYSGNLKCMFEALVPWNAEGGAALALNVRQGDWSPTTIQFFTPKSDSLGVYSHPGQLEYFGADDVDGDGRTELVLTGINNAAMVDRGFLPEDPDVYVYCVVLIEPPRVEGQAYPYRSWTGISPAAEEAYLLLPPLRRGVLSSIEKLSFTPAAAPGGAGAELQLHDGRIYQLDSHLRPLSCGVGDFTLADSLAPTRPMAPLLYIREGKRESIDLPVVGRTR
jgi:signal transduction histidine kinase